MTDVHTVRTYTFCHGAGITSVNWTFKGKYNEQAYFLNYQVAKANENRHVYCDLQWNSKTSLGVYVCVIQHVGSVQHVYFRYACVHLLGKNAQYYCYYTSTVRSYR